MKKIGMKILGCTLAMLVLTPTNKNVSFSIEAQAAEESTFSEYWFQDVDNSWKIKDEDGTIITNAWLCDDAISSNEQNVWYLLDEKGNMITAGLVKDMTGNYYSIETEHNGFYGMLRYKSGNYDEIRLELESSHSGGFAKILNQDGINALVGKYGVTHVSIDNSNCVYTSTFKSTNTNIPQHQSNVNNNINKEYDNPWAPENHLTPGGTIIDNECYN